MKEIEKRFIELCSHYASAKAAVYSDVKTDKKRCIFTLETQLIKIEFCYQKKGNSFSMPSTLYSRFYLRKNSVMYYHLPDVLPLIGVKDFSGCYFPLIENPLRMERCFNALTEIIDRYLHTIEEYVLNNEVDNTDILDSYKRIYGLKENEPDFNSIEEGEENHRYFIYLQNHRDEYLINLFTNSAPYDKLVSGDIGKAIMLYEKWEQKRGLSLYEKQLCEFLKREENRYFKPFSDECFTRKAMKNASVPPFWEFVLSSVAVYIPFAVIFCILFGIIDLILSADTTYSFVAPWYGGFLVAGLCGIFGGLAFRNKVKLLLFGEKVKTEIEMDRIVNSKTVYTFVNIAFLSSILFAVFASFMIVSSHALFFENNFKYTKEQGVWQYAEYSYDDIDKVYYMKSRYNDYGERINRASYVLVTDDGEIFDFDGFSSIEESESVINMLKEKGYEVNTIDSDKELAKITENNKAFELY